MDIQILNEKKLNEDIDVLLHYNGFVHYKLKYLGDEFIDDENYIEVYKVAKKIDENPLEFVFRLLLSHTELKRIKIEVIALSNLDFESFLKTFIFFLNRLQNRTFSMTNDKDITILLEDKVIYSTNISIKNFLV